MSRIIPNTLLSIVREAICLKPFTIVRDSCFVRLCSGQVVVRDSKEQLSIKIFVYHGPAKAFGATLKGRHLPMLFSNPTESRLTSRFEPP